MKQMDALLTQNITLLQGLVRQTHVSPFDGSNEGTSFTGATHGLREGEVASTTCSNEVNSLDVEEVAAALQQAAAKAAASFTRQVSLAADPMSRREQGVLKVRFLSRPCANRRFRCAPVAIARSSQIPQVFASSLVKRIYITNFYTLTLTYFAIVPHDPH